MGNDPTSITVTDSEGFRLDYYLATRFSGKSRSYFQRLIEDRSVTVNGVQGANARRLRDGDSIVIEWPIAPPALQPDSSRDISVIYEDAYLIVLDKPAALTVHPGAGTAEGTLVNWLLHHDPVSFGAMDDDPLRPGIVHRLDKDTTGTIVVAKTRAVRDRLVALFRERKVKKHYVALVRGIPESPTGVIETLIGRNPRDRKRMAVVSTLGKPASTTYKVIGSAAHGALLEVAIATGRTHQIRVHMDHIGHPVLGDALYGRSRASDMKFQRQMLHARRLAFTHPVGGRVCGFEAPLPSDFVDAMASIGIRKLL